MFVFELNLLGERKPRLISNTADPSYYSVLKADRTKYSQRPGQAYWKIKTLRKAHTDTLQEGFRILDLYYEDDKDIAATCLEFIAKILARILQNPRDLQPQTIPINA